MQPPPGQPQRVTGIRAAPHDWPPAPLATSRTHNLIPQKALYCVRGSLFSRKGFPHMEALLEFAVTLGELLTTTKLGAVVLGMVLFSFIAKVVRS